MATSVEQYEYLRLQDVCVCVNQKVNFYGVVSEYEHPKRTRGSDLICIMTIEDMSFNNSGLRILIFSSTLETLPHVKSIGDIIRIHRAIIKIHNGVPQAVARLGAGASFLLFDGIDGVGHAPYQTSSTNYTMQEYDRQILDLVRSWAKSQPRISGSNHYLVSISGIHEGNYFDLCCKVLVVDQRESEQTIHLHVWDGTDAPSPCIIAIQDAHGGEFPHMNVDANTSLSRDIIRSFPPVGTVLAVVPDVPLEGLPLRLPAPGSWVKLRNLTCRVRAGVYEAVFVHESKISLLSSNCELVKKCERLHAERIQNESACLPQWAPKPLQPFTVTDYEHVPFSTLREILTHSEVTFKFRCVVRVTAIIPSARVKDLLVLQNAPGMDGPPAGKQPLSTRVYRMKLTLEDPTARIHAILCGEDADHFFNGHPAVNFHEQSATVGALQRKIHRLLGLEIGGSSKSEAVYNPPWIRCCLKSYYLDKQSQWDSRCFRIFGTVLL